jgi:hypothetical protein
MVMNACTLVNPNALIPLLSRYTMRHFVVVLSVLCLTFLPCDAQVHPVHTESAMQCADTSKRNSGDVIVTNTCAFKIMVEALTPEGTQLMKNLDPGESASIPTSALSPWKVFSCTWPGTPMDPVSGKNATYKIVEYECDIDAAFQPTQQPFSQLQSHPDKEVNAEEMKFYGAARPYMDEPLPELKKTVHELAGLKLDPDQKPLPDLLAKVATTVDELLHRVPDLISDEAVTQTQWSGVAQDSMTCTGTGCLGSGGSSVSDQNFNYIILTHPAASGRLQLEEYRTKRNGKPISQGVGAPAFQGFVAAWVLFSSLNQVESRFRELGQQKTDGHNTYVIAFAQVPGAVEQPGRIVTERGSIPMLLQGVAWIDQTDFRIVRLRTDLLASQPEINYQKQTSNIVFGPVHIAVLNSVLWLPQAVDAESEARGQFLREQHEYSKYRLYQAKTRIIATPPAILAP